MWRCKTCNIVAYTPIPLPHPDACIQCTGTTFVALDPVRLH